jgi:hypothetical protein
MFHVEHPLGFIGALIGAVVAGEDLDERFDRLMGDVLNPDDVPRETSRPAYKELMMRRDLFRHLRAEIRHHLDENPEMPQGKVLKTAIDPNSGDLLVTSVYGLGDNAAEYTLRVAITLETDVPRETSQGEG